MYTPRVCLYKNVVSRSGSSLIAGREIIKTNRLDFLCQIIIGIALAFVFTQSQFVLTKR
jgi:hypothetical protein